MLQRSEIVQKSCQRSSKTVFLAPPGAGGALGGGGTLAVVDVRAGGAADGRAAGAAVRAGGAADARAEGTADAAALVADDDEEGSPEAVAGSPGEVAGVEGGASAALESGGAVRSAASAAPLACVSGRTALSEAVRGVPSSRVVPFFQRTSSAPPPASTVRMAKATAASTGPLDQRLCGRS